MKRFLLLAGLMLLAPTAGHGQTAADSAAIRGTALAYIEAWYNGDAERMEGALHPEMVKRFVRRGDGEADRLSSSPPEVLINGTRAGMGKDLPPDQQQKDVQILALDGDIATVKLTSTRLIDYMHLARWNGEWKIVNILWDYRPEHRPRRRG